MAATQAFLKETVLNSKNPKPGIVKVVRVRNASPSTSRIVLHCERC